MSSPPSKTPSALIVDIHLPTGGTPAAWTIINTVAVRCFVFFFFLYDIISYVLCVCISTYYLRVAFKVVYFPLAGRGSPGR